MDFVQTTGYLTGLIIAFSLTPQVAKAWKSKSTKDISILWNTIYILGLLLFLVDGFVLEKYLFL